MTSAYFVPISVFILFIIIWLIFLEKNQLKKLKLEIDNQNSRVDRYSQRVFRLEDFTKAQETLLNDKILELQAIRPDLKKVIQRRIQQLITHIFSLDEIHPTFKQWVCTI